MRAAWRLGRVEARGDSLAPRTQPVALRGSRRSVTNVGASQHRFALDLRLIEFWGASPARQIC
jgi:hypothetical protein